MPQGDRFPKYLIERNCSGFTLIEVILSTLVLSMVVMIAVWSYSSFMTGWQARNADGAQAMNMYRKQILLRYALESVFDYYVTDRENEKIGRYYPFFKGEPDSFDFITLSPVFQKGVPALARLTLVKENEQTYSLVYQEAALDQNYIKYTAERPAFQRSFTPYSGIKDVKIRYYGLDQKIWGGEYDLVQETKEWFTAFDGQEKKVIPEKIEIMYTSETDTVRLIFPVKASSPYKEYFFEPLG